MLARDLGINSFVERNTVVGLASVRISHASLGTCSTKEPNFSCQKNYQNSWIHFWNM